ncbi:MAG: response regulator transcription factor [Bacteroidales bacterium]|jgi:DNA-binding response OmpR family regulator|nr:response regulator transcription factor [Bacteroidales bacterium]
MEKKILIVDDEQDICEILEFNLANEGFNVTCANSAEEALKRITPDHVLILLDVMMGGMSGFKMAEKLRKENINVPIIFLTARDTENDMLTGFSVGGDDYITKPFSIKEVIARIKAMLKRYNNLHSSAQIVSESILTFGNLTIDLELKEVFINGEHIAFTKTEFEILTLLASNSTRIFNRKDIVEHLCKDTSYIAERTVDVHITRLRKRLGNMAKLISSRSGYGYCFKPPTK